MDTGPWICDVVTMRAITLIAAAVVFVGALIADTEVVLHVAATAIVRSIQHYTIAAVLCAIVAIGWLVIWQRKQHATRSRVPAVRTVRRQGHNRRQQRKSNPRRRRTRREG